MTPEQKEGALIAIHRLVTLGFTIPHPKVKGLEIGMQGGSYFIRYPNAEIKTYYLDAGLAKILEIFSSNENEF